MLFLSFSLVSFKFKMDIKNFCTWTLLNLNNTPYILLIYYYPQVNEDELLYQQRREENYSFYVLLSTL